MKKPEQLFKELLNENLGYIDLKPINTIEASPKKDFEVKYAQYLAEEAKVEEKKVTKEVEEIQSHNFDYKDKKNLDNQIGQEVMNGVYFESKQNPDKSIEEIKEIVSKNLAKDGQYYIKNAAFGVEGIGYKETELEEVSGNHKSSGYSDKLKKVVKESLMGGTTQQKEVVKEITEEEEVEAPKPTKPKKAKKESIDSKLAEIGKQGDVVKMEAQINFLDEVIEEKSTRLSSISEDENLSELVDKQKMKDMQKEVKLLEKKKAQMEKVYEKMCGQKYTKTEVVDEMEEIDEKKQGYNDRLDDTEGAKHGEKKQDMAQRRADSENMEKADDKRKFSGDSKMK
tara:strand:- start:117 stop:1136 length:1020 start_codon:yes stop_codon:yes gene_type:complete